MCDQQSLRSVCAYGRSDQSLCLSLEYSIIVKLLTELHLEFLSLKGGCRGSSESTHVKMLHCWKSHALAQLYKSGCLAPNGNSSYFFDRGYSYFTQCLTVVVGMTLERKFNVEKCPNVGADICD